MPQIIAIPLVCVLLFGVGDGGAVAEEHEHPAPEKLGSVSFPTSCSANVQKEFERGIALLHSFAYSEAEKSFRSVAKADPKCAMAHWGLAMTYFHQLWEPRFPAQNFARGQAEIARAKELGGSERERGFIDALSLIYADDDPANYPKRVNAYTSAMGRLAQANPQETECQVFFALALLASASPSDTTHANQKKAADLLEPLFQKNPQHPGIPHYLIHAYDNPELAKRGVTAARIYSQIAPSAPHALHMPSHIYTRLGMWDESIASNMAARTAARAHGDIGEELHAMDYLTYAYLQLGREQEAARLVAAVRTMPNLKANEFKVAYAASAMPIRYAIERRQWKDAALLTAMDGAPPQVSAMTAWARAVGAARSGDSAAARRAIERVASAYNQLHSAGDDYWATQVHVQLNEALAWAQQTEGNNFEAIKLMRNAAREEDAVEKRPVTPGAIVPAREQLADLLLESGHPKEALQEFQTVLATTPQRRAALSGAKRAAELLATAKQTK